MGLIDDKRNVVNEIAALNSVKDENNLPEPTTSLSSINNDDDVIPFFLDLLTVLIGSESLQGLIGELLVDFSRNIGGTLKNELKSSLIDYNSNEQLPSNFSNGYTIPAKDLDVNEKLKTDPSSQTGSLLYRNNSNDFDRKAYEAILNPGSEVQFNNINMEYNSASDSFTLSPVDTNQNVGTFINDYINGITLINNREFTTKVLDSIFGTVSSSQNKSKNQLLKEQKIKRSIERLINNEESLQVPENQLRELQDNSDQIFEGKTFFDVGCTKLESKLTINQLTTSVNGIVNSSDPFTVGNEINNVLNNSFDPNSSQAQENNQAIKDGFFKRVIDAILNVLINAVTTPPQIRALFAITSGFKNNGNINLGDPVDDLENRKKLADCISNKAKASINEFIFNLIKEELLNLIIPVSKIILKEKINQYLAILRSLTGFI